MVGIPTVKSFCGCCELRVPCIVLASIRMIVYIAGVLAYLYFFVLLESMFKFEEKPNRKKDEQVDVLIRVLFFVLLVNTLVSILFIAGVKSKNPAKMEYYVVVVGLNVILFLFLFKIPLAIFAVIDCFIWFHSYSLYKEYSCQHSTLNTVYTTVNTTFANEIDASSTAKEDRI